FYLGIYTPSKRLSPYSTLIGAIPGALPPLMGWTSSYGILHWEGFVLFMVLFLWQVPHFLAIAWLYQSDYSRAGLPVLPVVDPGGRAVARQVIFYLLALTIVVALPTHWGLTGRVYLVGTTIASITFLISGIFLARNKTMKSARGVFFVSIAYLPVWAILMVCDLIR
ncbi:MAG: protoheme IX farnesyltransferase, partial [Deltaproteobacteria bacterium]|nr:protoheme IX farnesyltransferase [Deltaproteobacteria bacterium]